MRQRIEQASAPVEKEAGQGEVESVTVQLTQYSISDLFLLMLLVACLSAILAPLARTASIAGWGYGAIVVAIDAAIIVGLGWLAIRLRKRCIAHAGQRLAIVTHGIARKKWVAVAFGSLSLCMMTIAIVLMGVSNVYVLQLSGRSLALTLLAQTINRIILDWVLVNYGLCFVWRALPGTIELYENGIVRRGFAYFDWKRVQLRDSSMGSDRLVCVLFEKGGGSVGDTLSLFVTSDVRQKITEAQRRFGQDSNTSKLA